MFNRTDRSMLGVWWWTIDRVILALVAVLILAGFFMVMAASPPVALRIGYSDQHFVIRHLVFIGAGGTTLLAMSMLNEGMIRVIGILGLLVSSMLIVFTLIGGAEVKGATRWISLGAFKIQPSEIAKPCFAITIAWLLSLWRQENMTAALIISTLLLASMVLMLVLQPDIGMAVLFIMTWALLIFLAGMPIGQVIGLACSAPILGYITYTAFPHVTIRVDKFIAGGNTQADIAMKSFSHGGLTGVGPGQGEIKKYLPDAHADFIYAVTAEEYGAIICLVLLGFYTAITLRCLNHAHQSESFFRMLAIAALTLQFGLQAVIHMASSLQLIPTKGMTLPFISYGGSSMIATSITIGLLIALTRRRTQNAQITERQRYA